MKASVFSDRGKLKLFSIVVLFLVFSGSVILARNIKFSVDMSKMVSLGKFNPATDQVYVRGTFNNWGTTNSLTSQGNNVFTTTVSVGENSWSEYKYFISTQGADNGGWENSFPVSSNGNRMLTVGVNDLNLATVIFNDANMLLRKTTTHFNIFCSEQQLSIIDDFSKKAETRFTQILNALQCTLSEKVSIYIYPNLDQLHLATGYPENGPSSIGSAYGKKLIVMIPPDAGGIGVLEHEFTHTIVAAKAKITVPAWVNEGVACYYGGNFSTKDWIRSVMLQCGKPNIADIFNTDMGYAYSGIIAYYIIKTKGAAALGKFLENMNYAEIGYNNLAALQTDWHAFLDNYLDTQTTKTVKFTVDMSAMIQSGYFNPNTNKVYVKGAFNNWSLANQLTLESGTTYSVTVPIIQYGLYQYRFFIDNAAAPNSGYEQEFDFTPNGNRLLDLENTNLTLPGVPFGIQTTPSATSIDYTRLGKKEQALRLHRLNSNTPSISNFQYTVVTLSASEYETQKPADAYPFDAGYIRSDGAICVTAPTTDAQKAVFADITQVAMYYLSQSYMRFFYQTNNLPVWLKVGFPAYEAGLNITDSQIKTALNAYGGTLSAFSVLNNVADFNARNGYAVAFAFGEFMNIFKNWGYPNLFSVNSSGFDVASWWWDVNSLQGLLDDFNRYAAARFLQTNEDLRIKMVLETDHFKFYTRPCDLVVNFPSFSDVMESTFTEYSEKLNVTSSEKITFFTLPECIDAQIEGSVCGNRLTGGTAWSSGLHSTSATQASQLPMFVRQNRHELAHVFQGLMPQGTVTAWLNEGFPGLMEGGPVEEQIVKYPALPQQAIDGMNNSIQHFGHRPTYQDTRSYPNVEGYLIVGGYFTDFLYRKCGYWGIKNILMNDLTAYQQMGYSSGDAVLEDFYFDFDVNRKKLAVVTLLTPTPQAELNSNSVNINWTPLKSSVKLNVMVSTNNKASWTEIANKTLQTSCFWNAETFTGNFYLKFVAPDNLNVETVYGPFKIVNPNQPNVSWPNGGEYLIAGDSAVIQWGNINFSSLKLEYSDNTVSNWTQIATNVPTTPQNYKWLVPAGLFGSCKIRISDASNASVSDMSDDAFTILRTNALGGPYLPDANTVVLMHFDNDLKNSSHLSGNGNGSIQNISTDTSIGATRGNCLNTNTPVTIAHSNSLNLTGDWTIEAWVKPTSFNPNVNMYILAKPGDTDAYQSNYSLEINPWWGNVFHGYYFSALDARVNHAGFSPQLNQWYHVAFIRDSQQKQIRLLIHDSFGIEQYNQAAAYSPTTTLTNTKDLIIGSGFNGYIDELRISNVIRSFVNTGFEDVKSHKYFSIYPNPTSDVVKLVGDLSLMKNSTIRVLNTKGQVLFVTKLDAETKMLDFRACPKGLYIVEIKSDKTIQTEKIIVR